MMPATNPIMIVQMILIVSSFEHRGGALSYSRSAFIGGSFGPAPARADRSCGVKWTDDGIRPADALSAQRL